MGGVVEAFVIKTHEGLVVLVVLLIDGGRMVLRVELAMVVPDISSPFVGNVGLELGGLCGAWAFVAVDACTETKLIRVLCFGDGRDEVSKGVLVNVGELACFVLSGLDPWWK